MAASEKTRKGGTRSRVRQKTGRKGNRFSFKSFSQQVDDVERTLFRGPGAGAPARGPPAPSSAQLPGAPAAAGQPQAQQSQGLARGQARLPNGAPSGAVPAASLADSVFLRELHEWRELNTAADFNELYGQLLHHAQTLPQLLFHRTQVMGLLCSKLRMESALSLDPVLSLVSALSQDLQSEFLPFIPSFMRSCATLLEEGGERDAKVLKAVFMCLSAIFKGLRRWLARDLPSLLRWSKRLRFSREDHVRNLAARTLSILFRVAPLKEAARGFKRALAEVCSCARAVGDAGCGPSGLEQEAGSQGWRASDHEDRVLSGCSLLLAHSLQGPSHGLHSRAPRLLHWLLPHSSQLLLNSSAGNEASGERGRLLAAGLSGAVSILCEHLRRESASAFWAILLQCTARFVPHEAKDRREEAPVVEPEPRHAGGQENGQEGAQGERRGCQGTGGTPAAMHPGLWLLLALLNTALHFRRGSRVNDYAPLFQLLRDLVQAREAVLALSGPGEAQEIPSGGGGGTGSGAEATPGSARAGMCAWATPGAERVTQQALELLLGLVASHAQVVGASEGPAVLAREAKGAWVPLFLEGPTHLLLPFLQRLLELPQESLEPVAVLAMRSLSQLSAAEPQAALLLAARLMGKCDLESHVSSTWHLQEACQGLWTRCARALEHMRELLGPEAGTPLIPARGAQSGEGQRLAGAGGPPWGSVDRGVLATGVAALRLVPLLARACSLQARDQMLALCRALASAVLPLLGRAPADAAAEPWRRQLGTILGAVMACMCPLVLATRQRPEHSEHSEVWQGSGRRAAASDGQDQQGEAVEGSSLSFFLSAAQEQPGAPGVLSAVSDFLGTAFPLSSRGQPDCVPVGDHVLLRKPVPEALLTALQPSLSSSRASVRLSALRILCHFLPPLAPQTPASSHPPSLSEEEEPGRAGPSERPSKKPRASQAKAPVVGATSGIGAIKAAKETPALEGPVPSLPEQGMYPVGSYCMALREMEAVVAEPPSLEGSRRVASRLAHLRVLLSARQVAPQNVVPLAHCLMGLLRVRFALYWPPALDCLAALLEAYGGSAAGGAAWEGVLRCLTETQQEVLGLPGASTLDPAAVSASHVDAAADEEVQLGGDEEPGSSTSAATFHALLLRCLQRAPTASQAHSRDLVPLFLSFVASLSAPGAHAIPGHATGPGAPDETSDSTPAVGSSAQDSEHAPAGDALEATPQSSPSPVRPGRAGAEGLKEWLLLLKAMKNARAFFRAAEVKACITQRLLPHVDPGIQELALECVLLWRDRALLPYASHLQRLVAFKTLQEELTVWDASAHGGQVAADHRASLLPVLLRLLLPKLMRRRGSLSGKAAAGVHNTGVLLFLGRLEAAELLPLYALLLRPLLGPLLPLPGATAPAGSLEAASAHEWDADEAALVALLERAGSAPSALLPALSGAELLARTPSPLLLGFLHLALQLLQALSAEQLLPFLPALLAIALDLLKALHELRGSAHGEPARGQRESEGASGACKQGQCDAVERRRGEATEQGSVEGSPRLEELSGASGGAAAQEGGVLKGDESGVSQAPAEEEQRIPPPAGQQPAGASARDSTPARAKELRVLSLRLFGALLEKFPDTDLGPEAWSAFFSALQGPLQHLGATAASSASPGALFQCLQAVAERRSPEPLLRLAQHPGFLPSVLALLGNPKGVAPPVVAAALGLLESICTFDARNTDGGAHQEQEQEQEGGGEVAGGGGLGSTPAASQPVLEQVVLPHLPQVLHAIRALTAAAAAPAGQANKTRPVGGDTADRSSLLVRSLVLLRLLAKHVHDPATADQLFLALLPLVRYRKGMNEGVCAGALEVFSALSQFLTAPSLRALVKAAPTLLLRLSSRRSRTALCGALETAAGRGQACSLLSPMAARLVSELNAFSTSRVDALDFSARLGAYAALASPAHLRAAPASSADSATQAPLDMLGGRCSTGVVLACALHDLGDEEETSLRQSAALFLHAFLRWARQLQPSPREGAPETSGAGTGAEDALLLQSLVLPCTRRGIRSSAALTVRREWVLLLREVACLFPELPGMGELQPFLSSPRGGKQPATSLGGAGGNDAQTGRSGPQDVRGTGGGAEMEEGEQQRPEAASGAISAGLELDGDAGQDLEADVFHNLVHLQVHRRTRALFKCRNLLLQPELHCSTDMVEGILLPLFEHSLFADKGAKEGNLVEAAVAATAAAASHLPWPSVFLLLKRFLRLLKKKADGEQKVAVRTICAVLDAWKPPLSAATALAEAGGAGPGEPPALPRAQDGDAQVPHPQGSGPPDIAAPGAEARGPDPGAGSPPVLEAWQEQLLEAVFRPMLGLVLVEKGEGNAKELNSRVALAVLRVLLCMPPPVLAVHLPSLLQKVVNGLKAKGQGERDNARATLVGMAGLLGPKYVGYQVAMLRSALTKGFQRHVLGYTLHALLLRVLGPDTPKDRPAGPAAAAPAGALDYCLEDMLMIVEADILGEVAEEKEAEGVAGRMKETRSMRSLETLRLLAQSVDVRQSVGPLLAPVRAALAASVDPAVRSKAEEMLRHVALGLRANPSASVADLLVVAEAVVQEGLAQEEAHVASLAARKAARALQTSGAPARTRASSEGPGSARKAGVGPKGDEDEDDGGEEEEAVRGSQGSGAPVEGAGGAAGAGGSSSEGQVLAANSQLLTQFGLQLLLSTSSGERLQRALEGGVVGKGMIPPLLQMLSRCLESRNDRVLALAFRCLSLLLRHSSAVNPTSAETGQGGQEAPSVVQRAASKAYELVHRAGCTSSELVHACLRMLTALLELNLDIQLSAEHLSVLLRSGVFQDLDRNSTRNTAFSLLAAVLRRQLVVPEVYDLMERVGAVMLHTHTASVRATCVSLLQRFLLHYPISAKGLEAHLSFLVANMGYEYEGGREAVLLAFTGLFARADFSVLQPRAEAHFVALVMRLQVEPSGHLRLVVGGTLKALLARLQEHAAHERRSGRNAPLLGRLLSFAEAWLSGPGDSRLQRAGAQVLGLALECLPQSALAQRQEAWLSLVSQILHSAAASILRGEGVATTAAGALASVDGTGAAPSAREFGTLLKNGSDGAPDLQQGSRDGGGSISEAVEAWEPVYYALLLLEKMLAKRGLEPGHPDGEDSLLVQEYWGSLAHVIRHPHAWVRSASARLLGVYFSACGGAAHRAGGAGGAEQLSLLAPGMLVLLAGSLCHVLRTEAEAQSSGVQAEQLAEQCVKNLLFIIPLLHRVRCTALRLPTEEACAAPRREGAIPAALGLALDGGSSGAYGSEHRGGGLVVQLAGPSDDKDANLACQGWGLLWGGKQKQVRGKGLQRPGSRSADALFGDQPDQAVLLPLPEGLSSALCARGGLRQDSPLDSAAATPAAPEGGTDDQSIPHPLLLALITSLGDVALLISPVQTTAVMKWLAGLASLLSQPSAEGAAGLGVYLDAVLRPLFRISSNHAGLAVPDNLIALAQEVMDHIGTAAGPRPFADTITQIRQDVESRAARRKENLKVEALVDPEKHSKRKIALNRKRQAQKAKKIQVMKRQRMSS